MTGSTSIHTKRKQTKSAVSRQIQKKDVRPSHKLADPEDVVKRLGFDSVTSYVWIHHVALPEMQTDYKYAQDEYFKCWIKAESLFDVPYYPNVTMGWDSSPRSRQDDPFGHFGHPFMNRISNNTPERFQQTMPATK